MVIVSLVRNNPHPETDADRAFGFLQASDDPMHPTAGEARAGVMFSRARSLLVVVGSGEHFRRDRNSRISRVYDHIVAHGMVLEASHVLFDNDQHNLTREEETRRRNREQAFHGQ